MYLEIIELVPKAPVSLPRHHPDVAPLVPEFRKLTVRTWR
jgi:hypothetical protein